MRLAHTLTAIAALLLLADCTNASGMGSLPQSAPAPAPEISRGSAPEAACLAEAVYFEAGGTGSTGQAAVAHVVVNRAHSPKFPRSICGVVADGCQFSYRCDGRPDALANRRQRDEAIRTAVSVLSGAPDITNGALYFHAASAAPGWFGTLQRVGRFGGNIFYR